VQVAGRINRENSAERKGSPLYVVDLGDCQTIYGVMTDIQARFVLDKNEIPESEYKTMVERYFDEVANPKRSDFSTSQEIFDAMKNLRYAYPGKNNSNKKTVSDFKIIEESYKGISVFVELPNDRVAAEVREAFQKLLRDEISREAFEKNHKRDFHQRIIAVPDYLANVAELEDQENISDEILWIRPDAAEYYYDLDTGFIRNDETESVLMF
jgi:CRISPR-associated endonuclease/helicase Cas3